jgi:uncharacterized lipoprotein
MNALKYVALSLCGVLLGACALSPQLVVIKPVLEVEVSTYGQQRDINVRVEDRRPSAVIGKRGGVYGETNTIEIGNDFQTEIAYTLAGALTRWGFRSMVNGYRGHALEFHVFLDNLSYQPHRTVAGKVVVQADVSVRVEKGGAVYEGSYSAVGERSYLTAPSTRRNEAEINRVLSLALQEIFADQGLVAFLRAS